MYEKLINAINNNDFNIIDINKIQIKEGIFIAMQKGCFQSSENNEIIYCSEDISKLIMDKIYEKTI